MAKQKVFRVGRVTVYLRSATWYLREPYSVLQFAPIDEQDVRFGEVQRELHRRELELASPGSPFILIATVALLGQSPLRHSCYATPMPARRRRLNRWLR